MVLLDIGIEIFTEALRLIQRHPNPRHLQEDILVTGRVRTSEEILGETMNASEMAVGHVWDGNAMLAGISYGGADGNPMRHMVWVQTTAGAERYPRTLVRQAKRMLAHADRYYGLYHTYFQYIPDAYPEAVRYAERMGFMRNGSAENDSGHVLHLLERINV